MDVVTGDDEICLVTPALGMMNPCDCFIVTTTTPTRIGQRNKPGIAFVVEVAVARLV